MAVTVITTPKGTTSNSYISRADATTYLEDHRLHTSDWSDATDEDKDTAIVWATALLDSAFDWYGSKRDLDGALRWPRSGVDDPDGDWYDYDIYPAILEDGTAELAFRLIQGDRTEEAGILGKGIRSAKVGPLSITVNKADAMALIPKDIILLLAPLGELDPSASSGGKFLKVRRT